jgi:ABC-type sugar transport system permease subunit
VGIKDIFKQSFIAFLIAMIVAIGLGCFVVRGLSRLEFVRTHEQLASLYANTISNFYISSDITTAQRLIEKLAKENVSDIKIVEGVVFAAHSKRGLVGQRIPKDLYDKTKELGRTKKAVISWPAPETINVEVPVIKEGAYVGIIDLNYKTPEYALHYDFDKALFKIESALRTEPGLKGTAAFINAKRIELSSFAEASKAADAKFMRNSFIFIFLLSAAIFAFIEFRIVNLIWTVFFKNRIAYYYVAPATIGMLVLVFFPIFFGLVLGFTDYSLVKFKEPIWSLFVGFKNFIDIVSDFNIFSYQNFYYTLFITVIWTASNVLLHVGIGVLLALILNSPLVAGRRIYRTLLILPWAVPNYITALIWKGMFQRQFGAINGLLNLFGLPAISWFEKPFTAFMTNLITNVWLGFPFMMVIALGALQSIPPELYEAAEIDGASPWQRLRKITLPLLRPAMTPAIILGVVWTFNMFNIIYLVSGGAPYGATDILITSAYRWAFEKYQYGYAAAYSTIIFVILLGYSLFNIRISRATESAYESR